MTAQRILERVGLANSHWGKRIIEAEVRGKFTFIDSEDAGDWVACACGKATADIPRDDDNCPLDQDLIILGALFECNVSANRFIKAAETLVKIENRAIQVAGSAK